MKLTTTQQQALRLDKATFVEAGAGSGKTSILVNRYLKILKDNPSLSPANILALTFTEKAAAEMLERIQSTLLTLTPHSEKESRFKERTLQQLPQAQVTTIHGFCFSLLKAFPFESGLDPQVSILKEEQSHFYLEEAIHSAIERQQHSAHLKTLLLIYPLPKIMALCHALFQAYSAQRFDDPQTLLEVCRRFGAEQSVQTENLKSSTQALQITDALLALFSDCLSQYNTLKQSQNKLDFHDLQRFTLTLLETHPSCRDLLHTQVPFVLVDEFQDTDPLQWDIIQHLATAISQRSNLFIVGDIKQSIYGFRGAASNLFTKVQNEFVQTGGNVVFLQDNFRSEPAIIEFVNGVFSPLFEQENTPLAYHPLIAQKEATHGQVSLELLDPEDGFEKEVDFIISTLKGLQDKPETALDSIAILLRRKKHMQTLSEALSDAGIPFICHAGKMGSAQEATLPIFHLIKTLIKKDNLSIIGLICSPLFGLSDQGLTRLYRHFQHPQILDKIKAAKENDYKTFLPDEREAFIDLLAFLDHWQPLAATQVLGPLLEQMLLERGYFTSLATSTDSENNLRLATQFLDKVNTLDKQVFLTRDKFLIQLEHFIKEGSFGSEDIQIKSGAVQLLSIHASKGLEFDTVIVPECGKTFNFSKNDAVVVTRDAGVALMHKTGSGRNEIRDLIIEGLKETIIEEEKRIFYVACTRAKSRLYLLGSRPKKASKTPQSYIDFLFSAGQFDASDLSLSFGEKSYPIQTESDSENNLLLKTKAPALVRKALPEPLPSALPSTQSGFLKISSSDLVLYLTCPKQYYLKELISLYPALAKNKAVSTPNYPHINPLHLGEIMHESIEWINQQQELNHKTFLESLSQDFMTQLSHICHPFPWLKTTLQAGQDLICEQILGYLKSDCYLQLQQADERCYEKSIVLPIGQLVVEGRIDTIYRQGEIWTIVDYKTDRVPPRTADEIPFKYRQQLGVYALGIRRLFGLKGEQIKTLIYFTNSGQSFDVHWSDDTLNEIETRSQNLTLSPRIPFVAPTKEICQDCAHFYQNPNCPEKGG